jgi:hypothetical protein
MFGEFFSILILVGIALYIRIKYQKYKIRLLDSLAGEKQVHGIAGQSLETAEMRISKHNREQGLLGEKGIGSELEQIAERFGLTVLHDLSVPDSKANIDHMIIGKRAVFIVDAKNFNGKISIRENRNGDDQLYVNNYNQTRLARNARDTKKELSKYLKKNGIRVKVIPVLAFYGARSDFHSFKVVENTVVCVNRLIDVVIKYGANHGNEYEIPVIANTILTEYPLKEV